MINCSGKMGAIAGALCGFPFLYPAVSSFVLILARNTDFRLRNNPAKVASRFQVLRVKWNPFDTLHLFHLSLCRRRAGQTGVGG